MRTFKDLDEIPLLLQDYIFYLETVMGKSKKTVYEYYLDIRMFLRFLKKSKSPALKEIPFDDVSIHDVDSTFLSDVKLSDAYRFLHYLSEDRKIDSRARARKISAIRGFYRYLSTKTTLKLINPFDDLEMPNIKKTIPKHLSLEESLELLRVIDGPYKERDYAIITLFLNCGMRLSELVGLNLKDMKETSLRVLGKGNKERMVYLNDACTDALTEYLKVRPETKKEENALFISRNGTRISARRVQQIIDKNLALAGLSDMGYSTHKLRHTAATLMFQYGDVDIRVLKEILGHENISTTEIYTHVSNKQLEEAVKQSPLANIKKIKIKENGR